MKPTLLTTAAAAALIAGASLSIAQDQMPRTGGTAPAPSPQQSAPAERSAPPMQRSQGSQSEMPSSQTQGAGPSDSTMDRKPSATQERLDRSRNAQDRPGTTNRNAQSPDQKGGKAASERAPSTTRSGADSKSGTDTKSGAASETNTQQRTTGQGAAGTAGAVNLTTEQRTKISTTIKQQNVQPVTNVNFSVSIGTRVPRTVRFHTLPASVVTIYPEWRGYSFILVEDEIVIINPRTYEIVYIIAA